MTIQSIIINGIGATLAILTHEYSKGVAAHTLGDASIKSTGRLSLNPAKHIDPLGLIFMAIFRFGWGKPTRINMFSFREKRKSLAMLFLVPFLANIIMGIFMIILARFWLGNVLINNPTNINFYILAGLEMAAWFNLSFALFNLLPIYPLSGILLLNAASPHAALKITQYEKILQLILAFLIIFNIMYSIFTPITNRILQGLLNTMPF